MICRQGLKRIFVIKARQLGISTLLEVIAVDQPCWNTGLQISLVDKAGDN
jgi:hypothetical protein